MCSFATTRYSKFLLAFEIYKRNPQNINKGFLPHLTLVLLEMSSSQVTTAVGAACPPVWESTSRSRERSAAADSSLRATWTSNRIVCRGGARARWDCGPSLWTTCRLSIRMMCNAETCLSISVRRSSWRLENKFA